MLELLNKFLTKQAEDAIGARVTHEIEDRTGGDVSTRFLGGLAVIVFTIVFATLSV